MVDIEGRACETQLTAVRQLAVAAQEKLHQRIPRRLRAVQKVKRGRLEGLNLQPQVHRAVEA